MRRPPISRDVRRIARLDRATLADLARAIVELAIARVRLHRHGPRRLVDVMTAPPSPTAADRQHERMIERIAFAVPRAAIRVPWRSDCLVQALAAQRWLGRLGIETTMSIGARKSPSGELDAHAWLKAGERIVTGGAIDDYTAFAVPARNGENVRT